MNGSHEKNTAALVLLLAHLPMSIKSLQNSGVGKTVNKLRKSSDAVVQNSASDLLKSWKATNILCPWVA